ncbi:MAG: hypothetical protein WCB49_04280 [Gammaproteobacteria bacterium]
MKPEHARQLLAQEAARILSEEGRHDFLSAKHKAAAHLGLAHKHLPTNREIETALIAHQRLFEAPAQSHRLHRLRITALAAMTRLEGMETRVAGAALGEVATAHSVVELHVFAEPPERVMFCLADQGLTYRESVRRHAWRNGRTRTLPVFEFSLGNQAVEATVFNLDDIREAPINPVDGQPMHRLGLAALEALIKENPHLTHTPPAA